jgi:alpha-beta hydrolase superfamily lysophospholipase
MRTPRATGRSALSRAFFFFLALLAPALPPGCGPRPALEAPAALAGRSDDGLAVHARLYAPVPGTHPPPGLILVHGLGGDHRAWDFFAERARRAGHLVIALDLRGHGQSTDRNGTRVSYRDFTDADWAAAVVDLGTAKNTLLAAGADPLNLAVLGEGLGGALALAYAARDPQMQAVVLVSPGLRERGFDNEATLRALDGLPVLLLAAEGDALAAQSAGLLKDAAPGYVELRRYPDAAHGTDLLASAPEAPGQVLLWLEGIIGPR